MPPIDRPIVLHEATGDFLSPNPSTTTRTAFTNFFLNFRAAPDAHELYKHLFDVHQTIIRLLVDHPAMRSNLEQTFSTPTNSKNKVYFMWDFVLRTFQFIAARVDPRDPVSSGMFVDVISRAALAKGLIEDETGRLEKANLGFGYDDDEGVEFGEEVKREAGRLMELPGMEGLEDEGEGEGRGGADDEWEDMEEEESGEEVEL